MREERLAVSVLERGAALGHRAQEPCGRRPVHLAAGQRRCPQGPGDAVAQAFADGGEREAAGPVLRQDIVAHEAAQQPGERVGIGAHRLGDLAPRPRAFGEHVGHSELRRDVEQLGRQVTVDQAREVALRRRRLSSGPVRRRLTRVHAPIDPRDSPAVNQATRTSRRARLRCPALWSDDDRRPGRSARLRLRDDVDPEGLAFAPALQRVAHRRARAAR